MAYIITPQELSYRQSLPLQDKIDMTCEKIESWYNHWDGQIYVAFSGGKDSTVLLDIVRNKAFIPDSKLIPAVFSDTGTPITRKSRTGYLLYSGWPGVALSS